MRPKVSYFYVSDTLDTTGVYGVCDSFANLKEKFKNFLVILIFVPFDEKY